MELKHIKYFCLVAETENVTAAAEIIDVSQPYLTKKIKQLEGELGVDLFDHVGRNIKLNQYGKSYYKHAKAVLETLANAHDELNELKGTMHTTFFLYTNVSLYMPGLLGAFRKQNPDLILLQSSAHRERIIEALLEEEADFAICTPPIEHENIETQILFRDTALVLLPSDHPLQKKESLLVSDLNNENFIITPVGYGMRDNMDLVFASKGVYPRIVIETADSSLAPSYVNEGVGMAMIPGRVVYNNQHLITECKKLADTDYLADVCLNWKKSRFKTINHQRLMDFMVNYYSLNAKET